MAVDSVFISSVISGFEEIRRQAATAVEKAQMHPVLAERHPANPQASRRAMFDAIATSDYFLLLIGARYGDVEDSGNSPTEEEFEEAVRLSRPALVLVQEGVELEARQRQFLDRVRGTWGDGVFYDQFQGPGDVGLGVLAALSAQASGVRNDIPGAQEQVRELVAPEQGIGGGSSGIAVRIGFIPVREVKLIDALVLEDPELAGRVAEDTRAAKFVPQRIGLKSSATAAGIQITGTDAEDWTTPEVVVKPDGSILVVASIRGESNFMGTINSTRLEYNIEAAGRLAQSIWHRLDPHGQVSQVATAAAIPDAQYKVFGLPSGNTTSMSMSLPQVVVAPDPALIAPRAQLSDEAHVRRMFAEIRRIFQDAGAVAGP
jgi:hypothetical protein